MTRRRRRRIRKYSNSHRLFQQHNNILANIIIPSTSVDDFFKCVYGIGSSYENDTKVPTINNKVGQSKKQAPYKIK
jgi:hypothetical protein